MSISKESVVLVMLANLVLTILVVAGAMAIFKGDESDEVAKPSPIRTNRNSADDHSTNSSAICDRRAMQIAQHLDGDSCHNVDRIARLPGTTNIPDKNKASKGANSVPSGWNGPSKRKGPPSSPCRSTTGRTRS